MVNETEKETLAQEAQESIPQEQPVETSEPEIAPIEQKAEEKEKEENFKHVQNWKNLRERAERAERERDEFLKKLQAAEQKAPVESPEEDLNLSDDDLLEAKHLKKYDKKNAQRLAYLEQQLIESRLKAEYPDFDKVVNMDTLAMLRDTDPELAESIAANPNVYSKAIAAYRSVKRYGLVAEDNYAKEREKVHDNSSKPRPVTSVSPQQGESPLSRANAFAEGLTPELSKQLWKEMQECRKKN